MAKTLDLTAEEKVILGNLLDGATIARDPLPYTDEFSRMKKVFQEKSGRTISNADFWTALNRVGKKGGHSGKKRTSSPKLTDLQKLEIRRLLPEGTGARDRLPYTPEFKEIHDRFSKLTQTKFSEQDFWRALSSVAKNKPKPKPLFETVPHGKLLPVMAESLEKANPWWLGKESKTTKSFRRYVFEGVWEKLQGGFMPSVIVAGPRRVGKSVLKEQIIEQLLFIEKVYPSRILHVQFDDVPYLGSIMKPILSLVSWYEKQVLGMTINEFHKKNKQSVYLFFDEIQNQANWASELKHLIDMTSQGALRTLGTGSSTLRIRRDQDRLAGRGWFVDLGPLRLREIASIRGQDEFPAVEGSSDRSNWFQKDFWHEVLSHGQKYSQQIKATFDQFSRWGGFPFCHNSGVDPSLPSDYILNSVVDRTINTDVPIGQSKHTLNKEVLYQCFKQLCRYTGQEVRPDHFRQEINRLYHSNASNRDILEAIHFFENSMLMASVSPMEISLRSQKYGYKFCLCDHFLRESFLQTPIPLEPAVLHGLPETVSTEAGHVLEGIIGYQLKSTPSLEIAWFPTRRDEPEVDFVLTSGLKRLPIEVKYRHGKPKNGDLAGIRSFCSKEKYNAEFGLVITQEYAGPIGNDVITIPASTFLSVL
ncbi:MAG: AAA family ATPase [Thermoguttaceae bacterium]|jgi:predicted AAA+ superfamily ATPase